MSLLVVACSYSFVAAQIIPCVDLPTPLSKGMESANVLKLQNFLYAKGLLKATPNGYFGNATVSAVRAYQKSVGLSQAGSVGPATRALLKKETAPYCGATTPVMAQATTTTAVSPSIATSSLPAQVRLLAPKVTSTDFATLFENGQTDWSVSLYGENFQKEGNSVTFKNVSTGRSYSLGSFPSEDGTTIILPKNLTATAFSCGASCYERLTSGRYEVTVSVVGAPSSTQVSVVQIHPFTISAQTGAMSGALPYASEGVKFGTVAFSASQPVIVRSVTLNTSSSTISDGAISAFVLKDEMTGQTFASDKEFGANQTMIVGAYVTTNNVKAGDIAGSFSVEVEDYLGKKRTTFVSPSFLVTVRGW